MIEAISDKIFDILAADMRLFAGGNAYASGWTGVKREEDGDTPTAGYVNLFDKAYDPDGADHRPAIYVGTRAIEAQDRLDFETQSSGGRIQFRILTVPLIVCVQATTKRAARQQRNQLRRNILIILLEHILVDGFWYELNFPGNTPVPDRVWTTGTGGGGVAVAEGMGSIGVQCRYSFDPTCDA